MSFEIELFAHETTDMSFQIEVCQWCMSLSLLEAEHETNQNNTMIVVLEQVKYVDWNSRSMHVSVWSLIDYT